MCGGHCSALPIYSEGKFLFIRIYNEDLLSRSRVMSEHLSSWWDLAFVHLSSNSSNEAKSSLPPPRSC